MNTFKKSALALALSTSAGVHAAGYIDISITGGPDLGPPIGEDQSCAAFLGGAPIDGSGPICLDSLVLGGAGTSFDVDPTNASAAATTVAIARVVAYEPNTAISAGSTVTFEISNGAIDDSAGVQLSDDEIGTNALATVTDFDSTAAGYTRVRFIVEPGITLAANTPVFLTTSTNGAGVEVTPVFAVDGAAKSGDSLTIAATSAQDSSGLDIEQGTAPAEALVEVVTGTRVTVRDVTSTIDVEATPSRALFVAVDGTTPGTGPAQQEAETELQLSRASLDILLGAEVGPDLLGDSFELTLARSNTAGVVDVTLDVNADGAASNIVDATPVAGEYVLAGTNTANVLEGTHNIDIATDGTTVLQTGEWLATLTVDDAAGVGVITAASDVTTHTWDINGAQFKIPYHAQNASGFVFFFNAVNETDNDAALQADVIVENKSQGTRESLTIELGLAVANGSTTVGQQAIKDAIIAAGGTMNDVDIYHVAMTLTANAPQNSVQVAAFQKDAIGRTSVPVYINSNNNNDGRKWQQ